MKIIEALKQTKDLQRKAADLVGKIGQHSAYMNFETPVYPDQKLQVSQWVQAHSDIIKEILRLRVALQKTNILTKATIELEGKQVEKTIAEWIHRRRDLAGLESAAWKKLTDKNLKEGTAQNTMGQQVPVQIVRCYDPAERDRRLAELDSEPSIIDGKLEIVNAITDLLE